MADIFDEVSEQLRRDELASKKDARRVAMLFVTVMVVVSVFALIGFGLLIFIVLRGMGVV